MSLFAIVKARPVILNLLSMVICLYRKNVCEFAAWNLTVDNKKKFFFTNYFFVVWDYLENRQFQGVDKWGKLEIVNPKRDNLMPVLWSMLSVLLCMFTGINCLMLFFKKLHFENAPKPIFYNYMLYKFKHDKELQVNSQQYYFVLYCVF